MKIGAIVQVTTTPSEELSVLRCEAQLATIITKSLEQQVAQLRALLATKTRVCEEQHKLIRLLESQNKGED